MAYDFERLMIPMSGGHEQAVDPRVKDATKLTEVQNGEWLLRGAVQKRRGFTALSTVCEIGDEESLAEARAVFSTGRELCVLRDQSVAAFDETTGYWLRRQGAVPTFGLERRRARSDSDSMPQSDSARNAPYIMRAIQRYRDPDDGVSPLYTGLIIEVLSDNGDRFTDYDTAFGPVAPHAPVVIAAGSGAFAKLICIAPASPAVPAVALQAWDWAVSSPGSVQSVGAITGAGILSTGVGMRYFDAATLNTSDTLYTLAWIASVGGALTLETRFITTHATFSSVVVAMADAARVAITCSDDGSRIFVLWVHKPLVGAETLYINCYSSAIGLPLLWGPVAVAALPGAATRFEALGCTANAGGNASVACVWATEYLGASRTFTTHTRMVNEATGALLATQRDILHTIPISRPFTSGDRVYCSLANIGGMTASTSASFLTDGYAAFLTSCGVMDIRATGVDRTPRLSSLHHVGDGPCVRFVPFVLHTDNGGAAIRGNTSHCWQDADDRWHFDVAARTGTTSPTAGSARYTKDAYAIDEVILDHAPGVTVISVADGTAIIGGGSLHWYDGVGTCEVSCGGSPVVTLTATPVAGGLLGGVAVIEQLMFSWTDAAGLLHRCAPGPRSNTVTPAGPNNAVLYEWRTYSLTNHADGDARALRLEVAAYRSDGGGGFMLATPKLAGPTNYLFAAGALLTADPGWQAGDQIYTATGELEAAAPMGGLAPAIVNQRILVAGAQRRGEVLSSKVLYTSGSNRRAPEFHESLGITMPEGQRAVACAELDGATVILTETRIYVMQGYGPDDAGANSDYSQPRLVSSDVGCADARSVVTTPLGVFWMGRNADNATRIYLLDRSFSLQTMPGELIRDVTAAYSTCTSAVHVPDRYQVRFTLDGNKAGGRIAVYDYRSNAWSIWQLPGAYVPLGACMHNGLYHVLTAGKVWRETPGSYRDIDGATEHWVTLAIETGWVQRAGQSGWQLAQGWIPLMSRLGPHSLSMSTYADFNTTPEQTVTITNATMAGWTELPREQPLCYHRRTDCQAARFRIADADPGTTPATPAAQSQGFDCAGIIVELAVARGAAKLPANQKG